MARKRIGRVLSGGVLALCMVFGFPPDTHAQGGYTITRQQFTITGSVGLPNVTMQGLPGAPQTDENGVYTAQVDYDWSGTVIPTRSGYTFEPTQIKYDKVKANQTEQDYVATLLTYTITCSVGRSGVKLIGLPGDPITEETGRYSVVVPFGSTLTIVPDLAGYRFEPPSMALTEVKKDESITFKPVELTFKIAGNVGAPGVKMAGLFGEPTSDQDGNYSADVPYNWEGTVKPTKEGYTFTPETRAYSQVMVDMTTEHYGAEVFTYRISGTAGLPGVTMEGFPDPTMTDGNGYYMAIVPYGWKGTVKPSLPGYIFSPPSKDYAKVTADADQQNFSGTVIRLMISGRVGMPGVQMEGFPDPVVSDQTGFYRAQVDWGWSGTVTPVKRGIAFQPPSQTYNQLTMEQTNQNYTGTPITYTISGNVGLPQVLMDGLGQPGRPVYSGQDGSYTAKVGFEFSGKVTPKKTGYTFEPESRDYAQVSSDMTSEHYLHRIKQYAVGGRITDDRGQPVADVVVYATDVLNGAATTDADGRYSLVVDHNWRGKLTPDKAGYTFVPESKEVGPIILDSPNNGFIAKPKMMSITDSIVFGGEPFGDVVITAEPGSYTAKTDGKGVFTVQVPYGWSGELTATKPGWNITIADDRRFYTNVTEDTDRTRTTPAPTPRETTPVPTPRETTPTPTPRETTPTPTPRETTPDGTTTGPLTPAQIEQERLRQEIEALRREMETLRTGRLTQPEQGQDVTIPSMPPAQAPAGPLVSGTFVQQDLVTVLKQLGMEAGIPIAGDESVKPGVTAVNLNMPRMPLESALEAVLQGEYKFKKQGDFYLVYRPITQTFLGQDLRDEVLPLIASTAGVVIVTDETVTGSVYAELDAVPLRTALDIVLDGTPYVAMNQGSHFLVASGMAIEPEATAVTYPSGFHAVTETRTVYLNWVTPLRAKQLLSGAFDKYVMADSDPNSHIVTVTAPPAMANRIVANLKQLDIRPRQVLLDARVVVMESSNLLNMGIEWSFPQIRAGIFTDSFLDGDKAIGDVSTSWPYGIQVGYSPDRTFTDSLLMALNLLEQNGQADIVSNPQVLAMDGKQSEIRNVIEDHYVLSGPQTSNFYVQSEFVTVTSGTTLSITPRIMDNNDIMLELAVEVSESIPRGQGTDLPRVTRRTTRSSATVSDGGTVAVAGLTETRSKKTEKRVPGLSNLPLLGGLFRNTDEDQATKEVAVFVTAYLARDSYQPAVAPQSTMEQRTSAVPATPDYTEQLRRSLANQNGY
ncbi:MAG: hypothetical protein JW993_06685 [Sedimentisphaerales bacterium]|nr:hypothetical protein [Sedimentisphaerales bacterium]